MSVGKRLLMVVLWAVAANSTAVAHADIVTEEIYVPAAEPGIDLYVRNKRPAAMDAFPSERILLFVHGATYPAEATFDLPVEGRSWMDHIASRGYDVYLMDLRGYGRSTRPPEMSLPAEANGPIVTTDVAVADFGTVVEHILERRDVERINVMGWSWGTVTTAAFAAANKDKVARLVLFAPIWLREGPSPIASGGELGAYRTVTRDAARQRWVAGAPEEARADLIPDGAFDAWWRANMAADPVGSAEQPPVVRAPNGVLEDSRRYWSAGTPYYQPADIEASVLLAVGEWDVDTPPSMAQTLFSLLSNAPAKRLVLIGGGTHTILLEKNREQLFREVQLFLDEALEP
jgi:pimeloyl-ACP methyl ester carboxylesterase